MIVHNPGYIATIEIDYNTTEKHCLMESYMKRHGWTNIGLGDKAELIQNEYNSMSYVAFRKHFEDIKIMESEIQDIKDAFTR